MTSPDEYRILVDMRWNKQYLDLLANKCSFEDEERYMEFLEALHTVANRWWRLQKTKKTQLQHHKHRVE